MFLKESDQKFVREVFSRLNNPVKIINFTQTLECQYCRETRELLEEIPEEKYFRSGKVASGYLVGAC